MIRCFLLTLLALSFSLSAHAAEHKLPEQGPVIVFDYVGGFTPPPINNDPAMVIYADGKVVLGNRFKENASIEGKITPAEVQALVAFAIDDSEIRSFDPAAVKQAIADKAKQAAAKGILTVFPRIADAPTTVVKINADGKQSEAKYYALSFAASTHKDIPALVQFQQVAKKLQDVRTRVRKAAE